MKKILIIALAFIAMGFGQFVLPPNLDSIRQETNIPVIDLVPSRISSNGIPSHVVFRVSISWKNGEYPTYVYTTPKDYNVTEAIKQRDYIVIEMFQYIQKYKKITNIMRSNQLLVDSTIIKVWSN